MASFKSAKIITILGFKEHTSHNPWATPKNNIIEMTLMKDIVAFNQIGEVSLFQLY
jgi:hypothetical protein